MLNYLKIVKKSRKKKIFLILLFLLASLVLNLFYIFKLSSLSTPSPSGEKESIKIAADQIFNQYSDSIKERDEESGKIKTTDLIIFFDTDIEVTNKFQKKIADLFRNRLLYSIIKVTASYSSNKFELLHSPKSVLSNLFEVSVIQIVDLKLEMKLGEDKIFYEKRLEGIPFAIIHHEIRDRMIGVVEKMDVIHIDADDFHWEDRKNPTSSELTDGVEKTINYDLEVIVEEMKRVLGSERKNLSDLFSWGIAVSSKSSKRLKKDMNDDVELIMFDKKSGDSAGEERFVTSFNIQIFNDDDND